MLELFLLCGTSFSGKSTLARALTEHRGAAWVSLDGILAERGLFGGDGLPVETWEEAHREAERRLADVASRSGDAVLDDTLCIRWLRERYRSAGERLGFSCRLIHLAIPIAVIRERVAQNLRTRGRRSLRSEVLEAHLASFEPPAPDEDALRFEGGDPAAWVRSQIPT